MVRAKRPMRRSSLIGPWGVGAIVPFPNDESLMIAGLDMWRYNDPSQFIIEDARLEKRLGVQQLRWPPDYREHNADAQNCYLKIPMVRFPRWHYCPFCGTMRKTTLYEAQPVCDCYQWPNGRNCDPRKYKRKLVPERFVVVCPDGHIDDFPIAEWLHSDGEHVYNPETCRIRRSTGGASASLTGVYYECSCGAKKSLAGATRPGALEKIGYTCKGSKPWLGIEEDVDNPCGNEEIKVVLRGATNVWFADTRSSIHIPTNDNEVSQKIVGIVDKRLNYVKGHLLNGKLDSSIIDMFAEMENVDAQLLFDAFSKKLENLAEIPDVTEEMSEDEYRTAEYKVLINSSGSDAQDFHSINHPISEYNEAIRPYFNSISLVPKLRETRAFVGFSRLNAYSAPISDRKEMLRVGTENWLPAIEVNGEGIFFEFNYDKIKNWARREDVKQRVAILNEAYKRSNFRKPGEEDLNPEFILIHTFAHLIINQLSFECGYGSSSIRERIYCEKTGNEFDMCGVLIYTASGDSEGSLGGLVRQGLPGRIEDTIVDAIKNAFWCTSDPVCIQSTGQGPESCNLAACHNCAILPETCCEHGNRLLDRGVVIGKRDNLDMGFFNDIRYL